MALVLKNVKLNDVQDIYIDSHKIVGIMGNNYRSLLKSLKGKMLYGIFYEDDFSKESVYDELFQYFKENDTFLFSKIVNMLLEEIGLSNDFLNLKICDLSHSEKRLLKYLILLLVNPDILVIDEPFLYFDYYEKRVIISLLRKIIHNSKKTIVLGSNNCDIIYSMCEKILLLDNRDYIYDDVSKVFSNTSLLDKYHLLEPDIIKFVRLTREKKIPLNYTNDIRDLMKEVYKNV